MPFVFLGRRSKNKLAEVGEVYGEGEIFFAPQKLHDGLEIVFAATHDADSIALDLCFHFWIRALDKFGDDFGLFLIEPGDEGHFFGGFEVGFGRHF